MEPFDSYPKNGREHLGQVKGANCRHEYGLKFMQKTKQTKCAYCGVDFSTSFETWLTMSLDHVVPVSVCTKLGISLDKREDVTNMVLSCGACNAFCNRYKPKEGIREPEGWEEFYDLRDRIFTERKGLIEKSRKEEETFFNKRLWEKPL